MKLLKIIFLIVSFLSSQSVIAMTYAVVCGVSKYARKPLTYPDDDAAYLVKGLKGAADVIVDKKITMGELFTYTKGEQHPILTGKFDRKMILVKN